MYYRPFPEQILGQRLTLKKLPFELAPVMFSYVDADRERLRQFLPWVDFTKSVKDEAEYIQMTHEDWAAGIRFDYGMFLNEGNIYLGNVGVHTISWEQDSAEIGYWILGKFEGKGYVTEAVNLLTDTCLIEGFHRLEIRCDEANIKSAEVPKRCGFIFEGTLRDHLKLPDGKRRHTCIYAKLTSNKSFQAD